MTGMWAEVSTLIIGRAYKKTEELFWSAGKQLPAPTSTRHGSFRQRVVDLEEEALLA
jgi:hypothetical protein